MAENYKHLYHQMKKMVEQYQDVIVPGLREQLEKRVEVVRCRDCKHYKTTKQQSAQWSGTVPCCSRSCRVKTPPDGFCCFGKRR